MAGNFKWTKEDCEIAFCLTFLDVSTVDDRRKRLSEIRGVSLPAINGKMANFKKLLNGEEAPKKDTAYFEEEFKHYDEEKCNQVLADFFYKNMGVVNEVKSASPRVSQKRVDYDFYQEALSLFKEHRFEESLEILLGFIKEENSDPNVWNLFGMVCGSLGDHQKAYSHFKKGFLLDSKHKPCFFNYITSCIAMSYTDEFFNTVLKVIDYLEPDEAKVVVDNFYEGIQNGAINLFDVPKKFFPYALYGNQPSEVILHLRDGLLPISLKVVPSIAAQALPINIALVAQWLMSTALLYNIEIPQMGIDKARKMLKDTPFHSGLFDGGAEALMDYFKSEKPILLNCYLHDFYIEKYKILQQKNAA